MFEQILGTFTSTIFDVLPIVVIIFGFQFLIIRKPVPNLKKVLVGIVYVLIGITFFLIGLDMALFKLGDTMAKQLTDPEFIGGIGTIAESLEWSDYYWVYLFAFAIGMSATLAEPSLIAVAIKANKVSGGTIGTWGLRIAVAIGAATGIALGTFRIVTGAPLHYFIIAGYIIVIIQTFFAPKMIVPLAYDSGGVTTSTVTVPIVVALGLGLAATVPGRSVLIDGFGMIGIAVLFPMISVMGYAQLIEFIEARRSRKAHSRKEYEGSGKTDN